MPTRTPLAREFAVVWLVVVAGCALSLSAFSLVQRLEMERSRLAFEHEASGQIAVIERQIQVQTDAVRAIVGLFNASERVDSEEFRRFVETIIGNDDSFKALEWVPRVTADGREAFERQARAEGRGNYRISELDGQGALVPAGRRAAHYPVLFAEPLRGNEAALGFDLGSNAARLAALGQARDTGEITASGRISLVQETENQFAVLLFAPVYRSVGVLESIDLRRRDLAGFALGVLRIGNVIAVAARVGAPETSDSDIYLYDEDGAAGERLLHVHSAPGQGRAAPLLEEAQARSGVHLARSLQVGGRTWTIVARPSDPGFPAVAAWQPWAALAGMLALTGLLATRLWSSANRARTVRRLVEQRTAELSDSNGRLRREVDERERAERALEEREARTRAIVDTVVDGIITIDASGAIETFNPAATRIFGYQAAEIEGRNVRELMPEPHRSAHDGYLRDYLETGKAKVIGIGRELVGQRKDGSQFPLELAVSPMWVGGQRKFTGIVRDITERRRIEEMKNEFISTVSHELRTPLTSIQGSLGLIRGTLGGDLPAQVRSMIDIAYNNSERLVRLINDILDIEKIEAGKVHYDFRQLSVAQLLRQAVEDNAGYAARLNVRLVMQEDVPAAMVRGDRDRLLQVMANLLSNAAKFSPEGDEVTLAAALVDGAVRISVTDHGPGVPAAYRERIFEKFGQADSSDTRQKAGTGLGLSISKAIVEHHGGRIDLQSAPGGGTTFFVDLPVLEAAGLDDGVDLDGSEHEPAHRRRILVCEDDRDIAKLLTLLLERSGFVADVAYDASQAKSRLAEGRYDAMTLDLGLPDQDGISLIRELRQGDATRELPVVVVSAQAQPGPERLRADGFNVADWLVKPIDGDQLKHALGQILGRAKPHRVRVLHVEDDRDLQRVVAAILAGTADVTAVSTLAEAKRRLDASCYDLILLDLTLPDGCGEELLAELEGHENKATPIIVFSADDYAGRRAHDVCAALVKSRTSADDLLAIITSTIERARQAA